MHFKIQIKTLFIKLFCTKSFGVNFFSLNKNKFTDTRTPNYKLFNFLTPNGTTFDKYDDL